MGVLASGVRESRSEAIGGVREGQRTCALRAAQAHLKGMPVSAARLHGNFSTAEVRDTPRQDQTEAHVGLRPDGRASEAGLMGG